MNNFLTNILVLVCQRQKLSSINVSKSSEIIQGSLMGPNLVHFRGSFTYTGALGPYFGFILEFWIIFLIFYEWIILLNILDSIEWIYFWMNILDFVLNEYFFEWIFWILFWIEFWIESFLGQIQWKNEFSKRIEQGYSVEALEDTQGTRSSPSFPPPYSAGAPQKLWVSGSFPPAPWPSWKGTYDWLK